MARGALEHGLTDRELEILWTVAHHGGNQPAAEALGLSVQTIKNHLASVLRKTWSHTALQAYHRINGGAKFRVIITNTTVIEYQNENEEPTP